MGDLVEFAQEVNRFQVLASAILIRNPLALLPRVIEIEHRGDRIDPEPVDMIALAPEQRVSEQEVNNLVPAIIEDQRAPILVRAFPGIFMFVETRAIETRQCPIIPGKMRRNPIDNDSDTCFMQRIDEKLKIIRRSVPAGRGKKAGHLVTPRWIKRMLRHRHEFDVREPHFLDVLDQRLGQFAITKRFSLRFFAPRTQMDFVNANGRVQRIPLASLR